jgi:hypothetical protein
MHRKEIGLITLILLCAVLLDLAVAGGISADCSLKAAPALLPDLLDQEQTFGAESNPTGSPVGGGSGYHDIVTPMDSRVSYTVTTTDEFLSALQSAKPGDMVYIEEIAQINLTGTGGATIPGGVTLASNRGGKTLYGSAAYSFTIEVPGDYAIWGLASGSNASDSIWTSICEEEPQRQNLNIDADWRWNRLGSRYVSAGQHTLTLQWREGTNLDRILITNDPGYEPGAAVEEQPEVGYIWIEAESGTLSPPMMIASDRSASGGVYIQVSEGSGTGEDAISRGGRICLGAEHPGHPVALAAGGENVRITGIRLEGTDNTIDKVSQPAYGIFFYLS